MEYVKGYQEAWKLFLEAFSWLTDVAKSTCNLEKKKHVKGTAFSYLLPTVEDLISEDVRLYFLSLQDRKREIYILYKPLSLTVYKLSLLNLQILTLTSSALVI